MKTGTVNCPIQFERKVSMKIKTLTNGTTIYQPFPFPETLEGLDLTIVNNTLEYKEFLAEMSDDYSVTRKELAVIREYRAKHPELKEV